MSQVRRDKSVPMVIYSIEKMHFKVKTLPDGTYSIFASDGLNIFDGTTITLSGLRYFEDAAYRYKRRNGLKKLREYLPAIVTQIKNVSWFCST